MGQPSSVQITLVVDEDLGLIHQAAKGSGMKDAIAVTLIFRAIFGFRFGMAAAAGMFRMRGIGREAAHLTNPLIWRTYSFEILGEGGLERALGVLVGDDGTAELLEQNQANGAAQDLLVHLHQFVGSGGADVRRLGRQSGSRQN